MKNVLRLALVVYVIFAFTSCTKGYETGCVTTGNPDNSYLDTTKIYCCGD
jgi:hypothetical protein